jgi:hypothetical protein
VPRLAAYANHVRQNKVGGFVPITLDEGDLRILDLVGGSRSARLRPPASEAGVDEWEAWRERVHEALSAELVDHGISGVIVNGYGLHLERLIDAVADTRGSE